MKRKTKTLKYLLPALGFAFLGTLLAACSTRTGNSMEESELQQVSSAPSGAQIWADTCGRCHNFRDPATLSDAQWEVAIMHMRVRAKLNGADARAVLKFLQSSN